MISAPKGHFIICGIKTNHKKASLLGDAFLMWVDFVLAKFNNCTTVELER